MTACLLVRRLRPIFVLLCALASATSACAATFCVSTSVELQDALTTAAANGEDDVIKVSEGTYAAPTSGFVYFALSLFGRDDRALEISGGWQGRLNNPCQVQVSDALDTVLDGGAAHRVMDIVVQQHSDVNVRLLTFSNGYAPGTSLGAGLHVATEAGGLAATWTIERNAFINNEAKFGAGLTIAEDAAASTAQVRVINNEFVLNHAHGNAGAAEIGLNGGYGIYVTNNTVLNNASDETSVNANGGIYVFGSGTQRFIANNNLWDNDGADLWVGSSSVGYDLLHNNIGVRIGTVPESSSANIDFAPAYQNAGLFKYIPVRDSPLVDAGVSPRSLNPGWYLTVQDLAASDRTVGSVDIGAFENERIFVDGFETSTGF